MKNQQKLPDIIILYGPPLAGKGTQGLYLEKLLPEFVHLDFGTELRKFVDNCAKFSNPDCICRAKRIQEKMNQGSAVETADLRFVVEQTVEKSLLDGKSILIEGPGRIESEAIWLSTLFANKDLNISIIHLHIDLDEALRRAKLRWYCKGYRNTFIGKEAALEKCSDPYQRVEDTDPEINTRRYKDLYEHKYARIIEIYQLISRADVLTIDACKPIDEVSTNISKYLEIYYGFEAK